jgi:hypothetical protein
MLSTAVLILLAADITLYPGRNYPDPRIEMIADRGPILELTVKCRQGVAVISYSKIERLYCSPRFDCSRNMTATIRKSCG